MLELHVAWLPIEFHIGGTLSAYQRVQHCVTSDHTTAMGASFEGFASNIILPAMKPYHAIMRPSAEAKQRSVPVVKSPVDLASIGSSSYPF